MVNTIFVPSYGILTKGHWQEILYKETTNAYWVEQNDWESPNSIKSIETLNTLIQSLDGPIFLIAHSLGGSTVVEWSKKYSANILGAVLVSFPDVEGEKLSRCNNRLSNSTSNKIAFSLFSVGQLR